MWGSKKPEAPKPVAVTTPPVAPVPFSPAPPPAYTAPEIKQEITPMTNDMRPVAPVSGSGARLGPSLHVKGEINGNEDLHVDGSVEGLISLEDRKLTVGASAKVSADISAREIVVFGTVKGNLRARDRIEIKKDGSVIGDLTTARIMIEDGAYFKGSIEIEREGVQPGATPEKSFARAAAAQKD
ncbi:MAG: polymer-forming cytoskeletal protein [Acidobacteria bacterium]|nr:polymer-forming cytoskeletal protein [Acidobacteriota bacterium]MCL5286729.1 polymer-forming cytoskeletal protein [Acidobacteriota bacterium]